MQYHDHRNEQCNDPNQQVLDGMQASSRVEMPVAYLLGLGSDLGTSVRGLVLGSGLGLGLGLGPGPGPGPGLGLG